VNRKRPLIAIGVVVLALLLVVIGRHERSHEQAATSAGIARVRAAIGPSLSKPGPDDYVLEPGRSCLLYGVGDRTYALELCFDPSGRIVEAVDRRGTTSKFYSLVEEPGAARLHANPKLIDSLLKTLEAE
jgi:hypothetical protein